MCSLLCVTSSLSFFSSLVLPSLTAFYVWWLWTLELIWPFSRVVHLSPHSCEKRKGWLSSKHMSLVCTLCTLFKSSVEVIQPHCEWGCYNDFCYTVSRNTSSNSDEVWKHHSNPEGGSEKQLIFFLICVTKTSEAWHQRAVWVNITTSLNLSTHRHSRLRSGSCFTLSHFDLNSIHYTRVIFQHNNYFYSELFDNISVCLLQFNVIFHSQFLSNAVSGCV